MKHTEICQGNHNKAKCGCYDEGISLLGDMFTAHKEKQKQLFFIGNGGSSAIASHMTAEYVFVNLRNAIDILY